MKIYTDLAFLDAFCQAWQSPPAFSDESAILKEVQGKFLHLLTNGATVHCAGIGPDLNQYNNQLLLHLNQLNRLRLIEADFFQKHKIIQQFSYRSEMAIFCSGGESVDGLTEMVSDHGYFFFSTPPVDDNLFSQRFVTYNRSKPQNWSFAAQMFQPHHSLVVADPHLYKDDGVNGFKSLLKIIQPKCLGYPYWITLIGNSSERPHSLNLYNREAISKFSESIERQIVDKGLECRVETFVYNGADFHDRYIITNNLCVLPGYGVSIVKPDNETPKKEGTWTAARPFSRIVYNGKQGVYFEKVMKEKLGTIGRWIKVSGGKARNPLIR
jgi:hypothetical protein